jgi:hypothetical protein
VVAAVGAVVADERAVAEQQEVRVRVEQGAAGVAAEAVNVPSVPRCLVSVSHSQTALGGGGGGCHGVKVSRYHCVSEGNAYQAQRPFLPRESGLALATAAANRQEQQEYLAAPLARIHDIVLVQRRLWVRSGGLHGASGPCVCGVCGRVVDVRLLCLRRAQRELAWRGARHSTGSEEEEEEEVEKGLEDRQAQCCAGLRRASKVVRGAAGGEQRRHWAKSVLEK